MDKRFTNAMNGVYEQAKRQCTETQMYWWMLAIISTHGIGHKRLMECIEHFKTYVNDCAKDGNNILVMRKMVEEQTGIHIKTTSKGVEYWIDDDKKDLYGAFATEEEEEEYDENRVD